MPEARKPCPCPKCNGALVTSRTVRNHASRITPSPVPSFSAWAAAGYHKRPYPSHLLDNEDSDGETGGPSKNRTISSKRHQRQVITVRFYAVPLAAASYLLFISFVSSTIFQ
jgi:hypothetical protein